MAIKVGMNAKVFYKAGGLAAQGNFVELTAARESTVSVTVTEIDVTTRGSGGWRLMENGLKEAEVTIEGVWDSADAGCGALNDAVINNTVLGIQALDATSGEGLIANMKVFSFERPDPLDDVQTFSATLKPAPSATAPSWGTPS